MKAQPTKAPTTMAPKKLHRQPSARADNRGVVNHCTNTEAPKPKALSTTAPTTMVPTTTALTPKAPATKERNITTSPNKATTINNGTNYQGRCQQPLQPTTATTLCMNQTGFTTLSSVLLLKAC
jgi:hypothetical protein